MYSHCWPTQTGAGFPPSIPLLRTTTTTLLRLQLRLRLGMFTVSPNVVAIIGSFNLLCMHVSHGFISSQGLAVGRVA